MNTTNKHWSDEEKRRLMELYPSHLMGELLPRFPGRTKPAIKRTALSLGLRKDQTTILRRNRLARSKATRGHIPKPWTTKEIALLTTLYASEENFLRIVQALPKRSRQQVLAKAEELALVRYTRSWQPHEIELLRQQYPTNTPMERILAALPDRSIEAVHNFARKLGIKRPCRNMRKWSEQELAALHRLYPLYGVRIPATELNRPPRAIAIMASRLGLKRVKPAGPAVEPAPKAARRWTAERDEALRTRYPFEPAQVLATEFGTTTAAVKKRVVLLGIKKDPALKSAQMSERNKERWQQQREAPIVKQARPAKNVVVLPMPKRAAETAAPIGKAHKELENPKAFAIEIRSLRHDDPLRKVWLWATRPGTKPADVPKSMADLRRLQPSVPSFLLR